MSTVEVQRAHAHEKRYVSRREACRIAFGSVVSTYAVKICPVISVSQLPADGAGSTDLFLCSNCTERDDLHEGLLCVGARSWKDDDGVRVA
jgi:hypothetical protein